MLLGPLLLLRRVLVKYFAPQDFSTTLMSKMEKNKPTLFYPILIIKCVLPQGVV